MTIVSGKVYHRTNAQGQIVTKEYHYIIKRANRQQETVKRTAPFNCSHKTKIPNHLCVGVLSSKLLQQAKGGKEHYKKYCKRKYSLRLIKCKL